jgi:protein SCO1
MWRVILSFNLALMLLAAGCKPSADQNPPHDPPAPTNQQMYQVTGVVQDVDLPGSSVKIKHDAIPGYMSAMTMPFEVRDTNELAGLEAGYPVAFRLFVTENDAWIDQIRKTGPKTNILPTGGPVRIVREVELLNEGDRFPEYQFTNQLGEAFSTAAFKGQAFAINFLFTRCPYPLFCPLTAKNFSETQQKLLAMTDGPKNWHLLTISFDPEFDTPPVLKGYAELYRYNPERWTFATGRLSEITTIGEQVGLVFLRDANGSIDHNLRTVVIDAAGRVQKIIVGNEWKSDELVAEMIKAAAAK